MKLGKQSSRKLVDLLAFVEHIARPNNEDITLRFLGLASINEFDQSCEK